MNAHIHVCLSSVVSVVVVSCGIFVARAWGVEGASRVVEYVGKPVPLRLVVGRSGQVELPEEIVDTVTALSPQDATIESRANKLFIQPLQDTEGELFVVTSSGASYIVSLSTPPDGHDVSVRIVPTGQHTQDRLKAAHGLTALKLVKAMATAEVPLGVQYAKASGRPVYHDDALSLTIQEAFFAPTMRGYVLQAENLSGVSIPVPVENLDIPGLLAAAAEQQILYPRPHTVEEQLAAAHRCKMYIVVK